MNCAVVIPSYKVTHSIVELIKQIGPEVARIYVIDDACPDGSGRLVEECCTDERISVLYHLENKGVGGAVLTGYQAAIADNMDIIIKLDGDGQMDPSLIPYFIAPIAAGEADYTKGNRFFNLEDLQTMPKIRLFGNALLSLMTKLSSGYWDLFDPTNGYTAIHRVAAQSLPFEKISQRYFFETDMLFRLNTLRAVVVDIPMCAHYGNEISNMKISNLIAEFTCKHFKNFSKRIFYNYYLRDMSLASIELPLGLLLLLSGLIFGSLRWFNALPTGTPTPAGVVMLAALPMILGLQFILAFIGYDIASVPKKPLHLMKKWQR
ncbi:glycosyltransferase family 2 protein [unidentified bacterial endosymbiont]|uniref:glycosyltransferase family 2 protein n=1 Tax=unidentified bacterial endosymbiont TaxID=2355 RepID=UPI0020A0FCD9|nr:glycosyltransferase family 2 protein [unidentified bacterial endosymbiont]